MTASLCAERKGYISALCAYPSFREVSAFTEVPTPLPATVLAQFEGG